jgi:hypothetical protein
MEKDVFRFEDFLSDNKFDELKKMKSNLLKEGLLNNSEETEEDIIDQSKNPYNDNSTEYNIDDSNEDNSNEIETTDDSNEYYKLYKDKSEDFVCDIAIEGVNQNDTEVRLIIESNDWNLMFLGEVKNGKCIIPVKKLSILNEGQIGNIKLEVNADGNLFTPWQDKFIVKVDKKVTVKLNENKKTELKPKMGVNVKVKK